MRRNVLEIFYYQSQRRSGIEIATQREHGVVGRIVSPEKRLRVLHSGVMEISHRADRRMFISEVIVNQIERRLVAFTVGPIVIVLPPLLLHGGALIIVICLGNRLRAHAIGFEKNSQLELIGRQRFEIVGAIGIGRAVGAAAVLLDQDEVLALADVFRTLK